MSMKDEVLELKKELEEVREQSFASEILSDYKRANKRQFATIIIILCMWFATIGYLVYILNDTETVTTEETIEVEQDSGDNGNNNFVNGNENEVNN